MTFILLHEFGIGKTFVTLNSIIDWFSLLCQVFSLLLPVFSLSLFLNEGPLEHFLATFLRTFLAFTTCLEGIYDSSGPINLLFSYGRKSMSPNIEIKGILYRIHGFLRKFLSLLWWSCHLFPGTTFPPRNPVVCIASPATITQHIYQK